MLNGDILIFGLLHAHHVTAGPGFGSTED
jgi:hypothetical protein